MLRKCPTCGSEVDASASVCPVCGLEMSMPASDSQISGILLISTDFPPIGFPLPGRTTE